MVENTGVSNLPPISWLDDMAKELATYKKLAENSYEQNKKLLQLYHDMDAQIEVYNDTFRKILEVVSLPRATETEIKVQKLAVEALNYDQLDWRDV